MTKEREALELAREALEKIAFAGMAAPPEMSEDSRTKWHAQQAFNFIGIAAWAVDSVKEALAQPSNSVEQEPSCQATGVCVRSGLYVARQDHIPDAGKLVTKDDSLQKQEYLDMVTASLMREGLDKHRAKEYAQHFFNMAQPEHKKPQNCGTGFCSCIECVMEQEPVAWLFQHDETGRTMCVDEQQIKWGFEKENSRWKKISPLYTTPPQQDAQKAFKTGYDAGVLETQLDHAKERNYCHRCGKRLMSALGPVSLHTCCPPQGRTFDDYGNKLP